MSTRKTIGGALGAIIILMAAQILAQLVAGLFVLVKVPEGICNIIAGIVLPVTVEAVYLVFFPGKYVSSGMSGNQIFSTLSAGIAFTGIAAGFVEEMVFRGVILNLLKERWNMKAAVLIPSVLFGAVHIIGMDLSWLHEFRQGWNHA